MATLFQSSASAKSATRLTGSDFRTKEDIAAYINTYWDEVIEAVRGNLDNSDVMKFFNVRTQKNDTHIIQMKVAGNAVAQINDDGEPMPFLTWGTGWSHTLRAYPWAIAVKHTRHLEEIDNFGEIAQETREAGDAVERTVRNITCDLLNRCIDDGVMSTGCSVLCPDGMYPVDSARPSPVVGVPTWSNLETKADITEDTLFTAELNTQFMLEENGDPSPAQSITEVVIPAEYDKVMWKLDKTEKILGGANNDANWAAGRFKYSALRDLTTHSIFYRLNAPDDQNGFQLIWQQRPRTDNIVFEDPRLIGKLVTFRVGLGALNMRRTLRAGLLNDL